MARTYDLHSRIVYANYDDIQTAVDKGILNSNDIIFCKDTREMIIVRDNGTFMNVDSRHYRFENRDLAIEYLNKSNDTYDGQIVSIRNTYTGNYDGYIVNLVGDTYTVKSLSVAEDVEFDYNKALNKPIDIVTGTVFSPIVVSTLSDGFYKVVGAYKLSNDVVTVYSSSTGHFVIVETINGVKHIKQITAEKIIDHTVTDDGATSVEMPTKEWIIEQNYATKQYVDDKLAVMNFFTKEDAQAYIEQCIDASISTMVENTVDRIIDERFVAGTEDEISNLFKED